MKVLVGCEYSGIVGEAFASQGHEVISCDLLPGENVKRRIHVQGDVFEVAAAGEFDLGIFFPPCTYLCRAQIPYLRRDFNRRILSADAMYFVKRLYALPIDRIAIENPIGLLSQWWRKPNQIFSPWQFGSDYDKDVCLWLRGLPPLQIDRGIRRPVKFRKVSNHVNSSMPQSLKSKIRSKFFPEVAAAMALQWSNPVTVHQGTFFQ